MKVVALGALVIAFVALSCSRNAELPVDNLYKQIDSDDPILDHIVQDVDTGSIYRVGRNGNFMGHIHPSSGKLRAFDIQDSILAWVSDSSSVKLLNLNTRKERTISLSKDVKIHHSIILHYPFLSAVCRTEKRKSYKTYTVVDERIAKIDLRDNNIQFWTIQDFIDDTWTPDSLDQKLAYLNVHTNSVEVDEEGDYYISLRDISQVWKISSDLTKVIYRIGANTPYQLIGDKNMAGQHSVEIIRPDNFFLFDNGSSGGKKVDSRIIRVTVQPDRKQYTIKLVLDLPDSLSTARMGSVQSLEDRLTVSMHNNGFHILELDTNGTVHNHLLYEKAHAIKVLPELSKE